MFLKDTHLWTYVIEDLLETLQKTIVMNKNRKTTEHNIFQFWQIICEFEIRK